MNTSAITARLRYSPRRTAGALALTLLTAACSSAPEPTAAQECNDPSFAQVTPAEPNAVLIVDRTGSVVSRDLAPGIRQYLGVAQKADAALDILAVDGAGAPRAVRTRIALDPTHGRDSQTADDARQIAIGCVALWAGSAQSLPTRPGSDLAEVINTAARQRPKFLMISSDGYSSAGQIDFGRLGFPTDPGTAATAVDQARLIASLKGAQGVWAGIGDTAMPMAEPLREDLAAYWQTVVRDADGAIRFDSRISGPGPAFTPGYHAPADPMDLPTITIQDGVQTIPDTFLFRPGSAVLAHDADDVLTPIALRLAADPSAYAAIEGHTADYGTEHGRQVLSQQRADAVRDRLIELGAPAGRLTAQGYGSTQPAQAEWVGGQHDLAAASANRRVVIRTTDR